MGGVTAPSLDSVPPAARFPTEKKDRGLDTCDWCNADCNNQLNNLKAQAPCNWGVGKRAGGWVEGASHGNGNFCSGLNRTPPCNGCVWKTCSRERGKLVEKQRNCQDCERVEIGAGGDV